MVGGQVLAATLAALLMVLAGCTEPATVAPPATVETKAAPLKEAPVPTSASNATAPAAQHAPPPKETVVAQENQTEQLAADNTTATVVFEPRMDELFRGSFFIQPVPLPVVQTYEFEVVYDRYDTLEIAGRYTTIPYAALPDVSLLGPDGEVYGTYSSIDSHVVATGTGGSASSFGLIYVFDPEPGTYTIRIDGAGAPQLQLWATGYAGRAPDFTYESIDGTTGKLSDHKGTIMMVDLMATWCGPCKDAMPGLVEIVRDYGGKVSAISVDVDEAETGGQLRDFQDTYGANWTFAFEVDNSASKAYGSGFIPTFAVIDQHGGLLYRHIGEMDPTELRAIIDRALEPDA